MQFFLFITRIDINDSRIIMNLFVRPAINEKFVVD